MVELSDRLVAWELATAEDSPWRIIQASTQDDQRTLTGRLSTTAAADLHLRLRLVPR